MSKYKSNGFKLKALIKECMPVSDYIVSFGSMEEKAVKTCKLSLKSDNKIKNKTGDNEIVNKSFILLVNVNSGISEEDADNGFMYCESIFNTLNKVINKVNEDKSLAIIHIDSLGNINELNVNKHGIWCFNIKFIVYYTELK